MKIKKVLLNRTFYFFRFSNKYDILSFILSFSLISFSTANKINIIPTPNTYIHHGKLNQNILGDADNPQWKIKTIGKMFTNINSIVIKKAGPYFL